MVENNSGDITEYCLTSFLNFSNKELIHWAFVFCWNLSFQNLLSLFITFLYFQILTNILIDISSVTQSHLTLCDPIDCSMPGFPVHTTSWSLLKFMSIESGMQSKHLILCHPLSSCHQSFPASGSFPISQLFTSTGKSIEVLVSASVFNEYSALICFKIDWFDLPAVQGTLKSLLQHHSS